MPSPEFLAEMERKRGSQPKTKIEYIAKDGTVTNISDHYLTGANLQSVRERAPDEIQAGQFDIVLANHDDLFSEFKSGSLFYNTDYHGARIRISQGFILPDGSEEYEPQGIGFIDAAVTDAKQSKITLRCRDLMWRIMDQKLRSRPAEEIPVPGQSNVGNGVCSGIQTMPFKTVTQTWTITCNDGGLDGHATFTVVGSVSGNIGTATSGTEFVNATAGIKFTVKAGTTVWVVGDTFTFWTFIMPQWSYVNAGKIIWSIMTGYNWDTNTQEAWAGYVYNFDHTKTSANTDLDYDSFLDSINKIDLVGLYNLKGYCPYDTDGVQLMQGLILLFLGSIYTGNDGRIKFRTYLPVIGQTYRTFADTNKVTEMKLTRTIDEVINSVSVYFQLSDTWPWSDGALLMDGAYAVEDVISVSKYHRLGTRFDIPWQTTHGLHVQDFADKIIAKYKGPPINLDFKTGMDGLLSEIGDRVIIQDTKLGLTGLLGEISMVAKSFDSKPTAIALRVRRDSEMTEKFGYIGSEVDEGDGISPQSDDFDTATVTDKEFAYFSQNGATEPDYRIF